MNSWKYIFPFFIFKTNTFSTKVKHFLQKIELYDIDFFLVTNVNYHNKYVYYFNKLNFFSLGPVNSNLSPWLLSYSFPVFSLNPLIEYFFIKFIIMSEKKAVQVKLNFFKNN